MKAVKFQSKDGMTIPGVLIQEKNFNKNKKHPALIMMYGGWGQMATLGWNLGLNSGLFNYLAQKGYVILIVDPRGSEQQSHQPEGCDQQQNKPPR